MKHRVATTDRTGEPFAAGQCEIYLAGLGACGRFTGAGQMLAGRVHGSVHVVPTYLTPVVNRIFRDGPYLWAVSLVTNANSPSTAFLPPRPERVDVAGELPARLRGSYAKYSVDKSPSRGSFEGGCLTLPGC